MYNYILKLFKYLFVKSFFRFFQMGLILNPMTIIFFTLLLNFSITHVKSNEEQGFISVEIFKNGIEFAKDVVINTAINRLTPLEVPPIEKHVKIVLIGTVHITLSNIVLYKLEVNSSSYEAGDKGVMVVASGTKAFLSMDWSYSYGKWIKISDRGTASVEVKGMEIGVLVDVKNENAIIKLTLLDCECHIEDISIKLNGGASWLYQGLVDAFEDKIRSTVENRITQKIEDEIAELEPLLESIPKKFKLDHIATLNLTVVNNLVFSDTSFGFELNGLFTSTIVKKGAAFNYHLQNPQDSVSCEGSPKMVGISIHEEVINSASLTYYNADVMHWSIENLPDQTFNTATWKEVIPSLYDIYPNDDIKLNASVTLPPSIKVAPENIDVAVNLDVTVEVLDADIIPVICISSAVKFSVYPELSRNSLAGNITLDDFSMSLEWSKIGPLDIYSLKPIVETVLRTIVAPYVNSIIDKGIPLPNFKGYTLRNAQFNYVAPRLIVCSDVASVRCHGLYPRMVSDT